MPRLELSDPRLFLVPDRYLSNWPHQDSLLDLKVKAMSENGFTPLLALQNECKSEWDLMRMVLEKKATVAGDFLTSQLKRAAFTKDLPGVGQLPQGVFADVTWGLINSLDDPRKALELMTQVAIPAGLTALTAVPLAGQLAGAYFSGGLKLAEMFSRPNWLTMPWAQYSREADQDLTQDVLLDRYAPSVDQTAVFAPPFDPDAPWRIGVAGSVKKGMATYANRWVWAPWLDGKVPWSTDNVGALPGSLRIFGQTQVTSTSSRPLDSDGKPIGALDRYVRHPKGITPREAALPWPRTVINAGDFYPAAAQAAGVLWNMAERAGAPDMYKIHVAELLDAWGRLFTSMEESFIGLWSSAQGMTDTGALDPTEARSILGRAMEPWVAVRLRPDLPWTLGSPWRVPSRWGLITPAIYSGGLPGDPAGRTGSMWIEENLAKLQPAIDPLTGLLSIDNLLWPYGKRPKQHHCSRWKACSSDLAATANMGAVLHPASYKTAGGPPPTGYRKQPWPPPEADAAEWASPYKAFVRPALQRLRVQQEASLKSTIVCAYTRHLTVGDLPAYGAFKDAELGKLCHDMRELLLKSKHRYRVNLTDAQAIDPVFTERLRAAGVTNGPGDYSKSLGLAADAPLVDNAAPPPAGEPPQGGVPFERGLVAAARDGGSGAGTAVAILGLLWLGAKVLKR